MSNNLPATPELRERAQRLARIRRVFTTAFRRPCPRCDRWWYLVMTHGCSDSGCRTVVPDAALPGVADGKELA